jgi:hypothetical protein
MRTSSHKNPVKAKFAEHSFRNCPKSLGGARGVALRAAEKLLFEPFRAPHTGQINVGALFLPLFGQFLHTVRE